MTSVHNGTKMIVRGGAKEELEAHFEFVFFGSDDEYVEKLVGNIHSR